jgi:hypothetical protein
MSCCGSRLQGGQLFGRRSSLQGQGKALVVVPGFPGAEAHRGRVEVGELVAPPRLLMVDPVTALDLPVLLRAPRPDVAVPDPERLYGQGESEGNLWDELRRTPNT